MSARDFSITSDLPHRSNDCVSCTQSGALSPSRARRWLVARFQVASTIYPTPTPLSPERSTLNKFYMRLLIRSFAFGSDSSSQTCNSAGQARRKQSFHSASSRNWTLILASDLKSSARSRYWRIIANAKLFGNMLAVIGTRTLNWMW